MTHYRKKPVLIEAMQFTRQNIPAVRRFAPIGLGGCRGVFVRPDGKWFDDDKHDWPGEVHEAGLLIPTLEGDMLVRENDWIIQGVQGEFYPCKPAIFDATYEAVLPGNE